MARCASASRPAGPRQRGAALLTAMIIVALVATLAASMVWQQWRAVQVESAERARAQSAWILLGALDFGRLILKETARPGKPTTLNDPWATPLAESRLSTFLAVDKANADDGPEAFLSGSVNDAQARYNLANVVQGTPPQINKEHLKILENLCTTVNIGAGTAARIANGLLAAKTGGAAAPLDPTSVSQLSWLGLTPAEIEALRPFVIVLPRTTLVNINTAPKEVLAAVLNTGDGNALRVVQARQRKALVDAAGLQAALGEAPAGTAFGYAASDVFEVRGRLRLGDHVLTERTLVYRSGNQFMPYRQQQERVSSVEETGAR